MSSNDSLILFKGLITTAKNLDREVTPFVRINVSASNPGGVGTSKSYAAVEVTIQDTNDNKPVFENLPGRVDIPENAHTEDLPFFTFNASDPDLGNNGSVSFSLLTENSPFILNSSTGELFLVMNLDREEQSSYNLEIAAFDLGTPISQTSTSSLLVAVSDVNDNVPRFYPVLYYVSVSDCSPQETTIGTVSATDADRPNEDPNIRYSIESGNEAKRFEIDNSTGKISASQVLKIEDENWYQLTIAGVDCFGNGNSTSNTATVRISITPCGDSEDGGFFFTEKVYRFYLLENKRYESFGQVTVKGSEVSADTPVKFDIIAGDPDKKFQISNGSGILGLGSNHLNREVTSFFNLTVAAVLDNLMATSFVEIFVMDMNDHAPLWPSRVINIYVDETVPVNSAVAVLNAQDGDDGNEVYYTLATHSTFFKVREDKIYNIVSLEAYVETTQDVEIVASDNGVPSLSSSVSLAIHVVDVNNHGPVFDKTQNSFVFTISELLPATSLIFQYTVTDQDHGINSQIQFSVHIDSNPQISSANLPFGIFPDGQLYLSRPLVDENLRQDWYKFYVTAADRGTPSLCSTETVWIYVTDFNDNSPALISENFITAFINSSNKPNTHIGQLEVVDKDKGRNGKTVFSSLSPSQTKFFRIDTITGDIFTTVHFDYRCHGNEYTFQVDMTDFGNQTRNTSVFVTVKLKFEDIEKFSVVTFTQSNFHANIYKNNEPSDQVIMLTVQKPIFETVLYEFSFANNAENFVTDMFDLNQTTGVLRTKVVLDRESIGSTLKLPVQLQQFIGNDVLVDLATVVVSILDLNDNDTLSTNTSLADRNLHVPETTQNFSINVQNVNQKPPQCKPSDLPGTNVLTFEENLPSNFAIGTIEIQEREFEHEYFTFELTDHDSDFRIDELSGVVFTERSFDAEENKFLQINVRVCDQMKDLELYGTEVESELDVNESLCSICSPWVEVKNVDDNYPSLLAEKFSFKDEEYQYSVEFEVSSVSAIDDLIGWINISDVDVSALKG